MTKVTLGFFDEATGEFVLDAELPVAAEAAKDLGLGQVFGCANATDVLRFPDQKPWLVGTETTIQVSGYWHNSHVEGPGRRSVVRVQGCPIRCKGCWVPETWDASAGQNVGVATVAQALLDSDYSRDGVTILGGEPFAQPEALASLLEALLSIDPKLNICVYSGYTWDRLQQRAEDEPDVMYSLAVMDTLIDGPYIQAMAHKDCDCSEEVRQFTGSCNQKVRHFTDG